MATRDYRASCRRLFGQAIMSALMFAVPGCGDSRLVSVSGVVTLDGEPVGDVVVLFRPNTGNPEDPEFCPTSHGITDDQGRFEMETLDDAGAIPGEHVVTLAWKDPDRPKYSHPAADQTAMTQQEFKLPPRARDGSIKFTVPDGGTKEANFAFESREMQPAATGRSSRF